MLSNGLGPSRHFLLTVSNLLAHPQGYRISTPINNGHRTLYRQPFICQSCVRRGFASKRRADKHTAKPKNEPYLRDSIKTLESHVQFLKSSFKEVVDRRTKSGPKTSISDDLQDKAYEALMLNPPSIPLIEGTETSIYQLLPERFLESLGPANLQLTNQDNLEWDSWIAHLNSSRGFKGLQSREIDTVIHCMDAISITKHTETILRFIREAGLKPRILTYDLLMMGNASQGNLDMVQRLFLELKAEGHKPTVYSYGHLLKALSPTADLVAAAKAFKEMQELNIEPNLTVYTTLLHICIKANEVGTAWKVFDLMKYRGLSTHPDVKAYSLMIHACALDGEAEKALDIFNDMTVRHGIEPTASTYNSLIHVCTTRKDYYSQAWKFAKEMQSKGMPFTTRTLNLLLLACGRIGELTRARMLLRHMLAGSEAVQPEEETFQAVFRAYANYRPKFTKKASKEHQLRAIQQDPTRSPETFVHLKVQTPERIENDPMHKEARRLSDFDFLTRSCPTSYPDTVDEARRLFELVRKYYPGFISTQLTNSLLELFLNKGYHDTLERAYSLLYKPAHGSAIEIDTASRSISTSATASASELASAAKAEKNSYTYEIALKSAYVSRNITFARQVYSQREEFVKSQEFKDLPHKARNEFNFHAERIFIDTLARCEFLGEACERLTTARERFGPERWTRHCLRTVRIKAVQLEDMKTVQFLDTFASDGWVEAEMERKVQDVEGRFGWERSASTFTPNVSPRRKRGSQVGHSRAETPETERRKVPGTLNVHF